MGRLFNERVRDDFASKPRVESESAYLGRSARRPFARIRGLLERWFATHPEFDDPQWLGRFRSENDRHHFGAFFELCCAELLTRQGFLLEREVPANAGVQTKPDFRVRRRDEPHFFFECALGGGREIDDPAKERHRGRIVDELNRLDSPNFRLRVNFLRLGSRPPQLSRLRDRLQAELDSLDPDDAVRRWEDERVLTTWLMEEDGWEIEFSAIPKAPADRGKSGMRPVAWETTGVRLIDPPKPLLKALKRKAGHYGDPDLPLVLAVDALDLFAGEDAFADVLLGRRQVVINTKTGDARIDRRPDGLWFGAVSPRNTRVSAVLFALRLEPSTAARAELVLWHNPEAKRPLDPDVWQGKQMVPNRSAGLMELREGKSAAQILGIDPDWPFWDDDEDG